MATGVDTLDSRRLRFLTRIMPIVAPPVMGLDNVSMALAQPIIIELLAPLVGRSRVSEDLCLSRPNVNSIKPDLEQPQPCGSGQVRIEDKTELLADWSAPPGLQDFASHISGLDSSVENLTDWFAPPDLRDLTPHLRRLIASSIENLTDWFILPLPPIEEHSVQLGRTRANGKSYGAETPEAAGQLSLFPGPEDTTRCMHGMQKRFCAICMQQSTQTRAAKNRKPQVTINPFDLILPLLQPPLGANLDNPLAFPPNKQLYGFQRQGVVFLAEHQVALLGDEMGLGKSIQAIVALRVLLACGKINTAIILSPKSVLTDWERKLREWAPGVRVVVIRGTRSERETLWATEAHIYLTTYETLRQDLSASLNADYDDWYAGGTTEPKADIAKTVFDIAILDEIQRIKNPGTGVTKAARLLKAKRRWGLSGTPLENRVEEVISIFAFLKPGLLRYEDACRPTRVKERIRPYFLRRRKTEALGEDFPEKVSDDVWLDMGEGQRAAYDAAEAAGTMGLRARGTKATVQHVLALITKLKQICNLDPNTGESCKLDYLLENLPQVIEEDSKALVFSQYPNKTLQPVKEKLSDFGPLLYDGSLSETQRDRIIDAFQRNDENRVMLLSVRAGGQGLTLTRANYVFHYDLWWNPAVAAQAEDRAHRIGQDKTVFVTYLYTVDTIEERIHNLLERKRELFSTVIDELSDTRLGNVLSEEELFGLFGLKPPQKAGQTETRKAAGVDWLRDISPDGFEKLVAELFARMGYRAELTRRSRDHGVDIYATRVTKAGFERIAIQCKHYPNRPVGVEVARELYGALQAKPDITRGILVTTGAFSRECADFSRGRRIDLMDGAYVRGLLARHGIEQVG